jgi:hypothetical protein
LLGYDLNSCAYRVFNKDSCCVKTTCDALFDETNGSQEEQINLDLVDDESASCDALKRMTIGDVRPQDPCEQPEGLSPSDTTPLTQGLDQEHEKNQDEHENEDADEDEDEHNNQVQEKRNDQGEDEDDKDKEESNSRATRPHQRLCHTVQRDHPVNNILEDIKKGVITRARVVNFYEHDSFVSSFEPFKIEDALCDLN